MHITSKHTGNYDQFKIACEMTTAWLVTEERHSRLINHSLVVSCSDVFEKYKYSLALPAQSLIAQLASKHNHTRKVFKNMHSTQSHPPGKSAHTALGRVRSPGRQ